MKPLITSFPLGVVIYVSVLQYLARAIIPPDFPPIWSNTGCSNSAGGDYNWTINSEEQTPCQVAEQLTLNCNFEFTGDSDGIFPVDEQDGCLCNTVIFSLMNACVWCNPDWTILDSPTWGNWLMTNNCTVSNVSSQVRPSIITSVLHSPLPTKVNVVVPAWAFISDISTDDIWPSDSAMEVALNGVSLMSSMLVGPTAISTGLSGGMTISQQVGGNTETISNFLGSNTDVTQMIGSDDSTTVIVGAVLGSVLGVVCIGFGAFLIVRSVRRKRRKLTGLNYSPGSGNHDITIEPVPFVNALPVGVPVLQIQGQPAATQSLFTNTNLQLRSSSAQAVPPNSNSMYFPPSVEEERMTQVQVEPSDSVSNRGGSIIFGNEENNRRTNLNQFDVGPGPRSVRDVSPPIRYTQPTEVELSERVTYYSELPSYHSHLPSPIRSPPPLPFPVGNIPVNGFPNSFS